MDAAGTVEAVGNNVTQFQPGDEVFGVCDGAFAEYARARADKFASKPKNLTFEQAAAVPTSAATALHALRIAGDIGPAQKVLIIGASGGVGIFAVQIAKSFGAEDMGWQPIAVRPQARAQSERDARHRRRRRWWTLVSLTNREDLLTLRDLVEAGKLTPVIDSTYPMSDVPEAMHALEAGRARGKLVIRVI